MYAKKFICYPALIASLLFAISCRCQQYSIQQLQENSLKVDRVNYLKIVVDNVQCDSILLVADAKVGYIAECVWKVIPLKFHKPASFRLNIYEKKPNDTIKLGSEIFRTVKYDVLGVDFRFQSHLTKEELIDIGELRTFERYAAYGHHSSQVKSFKILALRDNVVFFLRNPKLQVR